jgi:ubiquinone/menaquinone biosynthesis C-methylase UbiE/rhodanese-related sulfurtransferase
MMAERDPWSETAPISHRSSELLSEADAKLLELAKLTPGARVLDVGCGTGWLTSLVGKAVGDSGKVMGVDTSPALVEYAQTVRSANHVQFRVQDSHELNYKEGVFDVIFMRLSLAFFEEPKRVLERSHFVLKPGGRLVIMTLGKHENNTFLRPIMSMAAQQAEAATLFGDSVDLCRALEEAGFESPKARLVPSMVTVTDPNEYWEVVRSMLGLPWATIPGPVKEALGAEAHLGLELVFALGQKHDPKAKVKIKVKDLPEVTGSVRRRIQEMNPFEIKKNLKQRDLVYLDVREADECKEGFVKGGVRLPRGELELRVQSEIPSAETPIVVISRDGHLGVLAASTLQNLGYKNVWNVLGGFLAWKADGMPVEPGAR